MEATTISAIIAALLAISEVLALIPKVKANGVFQMLWNLLKTMVDIKKKE